jgi:rhomboid protease GluP
MFVHIGIIHIAVNMLSLVSLGRLLESFIGRWRFLLLYLLTGICSSAVSTWFHEVPAAGASGAIFGLFGIFVAIVTTNLIEPSARKKMLRSIATTILLNAVIGLWAGIDNSAHIGGFLSGMIGGYLITVCT